MTFPLTMNNILRTLNQYAFLKHIFYWAIFVLFWGIIWGLSDYEFSRNILIQISCLPSRMLLVYVSLYVLFPKFFLKKRYLEFFIFYCVLVLVISIFIQRPFMLFYVQPAYLPNWNTDNFFGSSEIVNTALDINIAAIIPLGYTFLKTFESLKSNNSKLTMENETLKDVRKAPSSIELKIDKSIHRIAVNDINYVESLRNNVKIKLQDNELIVRQNISSLEEVLPEDVFIRVHRSFIINTEKVSSFSPSKIELNETAIPVGRKYKEDVLQKLGYSKKTDQTE